jgi:hypothetical protein
LKIRHFGTHTTITITDANVACRSVRKDGGVEEFLQRSAAVNCSNASAVGATAAVSPLEPPELYYNTYSR